MIEETMTTSPEIEASAPESTAPVETTEVVASAEEKPAATESAPKSIKEHIEKIKAQADKEVAPKVDGAEKSAEEKPYTPDLKFKVLNKEHEIPELLRGAIKTPEDEKAVKEILEKAYGLEHVKAERARVQEDLRSVNTKFTGLTSRLQDLQNFIDKDDLGTFFKSIQLSDTQVMKYALHLAELQDLPPHQRQVYNDQQQLKQRNYELERQFQEQSQNQFETTVQQRQAELQQVMSEPDVAPFAQAFDQRNGEGAFWNQVKFLGQAHFNLTGQDMSAKDVVQDLMKKFGNASPAQPVVTPQPVVQEPKASVKQAAKPVIPNTGGSTGVSPAGRSIKSIDDLKKTYKEKYG